jgi:hypothetical protein
VVLQFRGEEIGLVNPVAVKLKYHRLKPGGVVVRQDPFVVVKLKYHRLKPGGVVARQDPLVVVKLKYHRLKPGGVPSLCHLAPNRTSVFSKVCEYAKKCCHKLIQRNPIPVKVNPT